MIHYHGGPVWPTTAAVALWTRRHGLTSFAESMRALVLAERIEMHASATTWSKKHGTQMNLELVG